MAAAGSAGGIASGIIVGGFLCLGLFLLAIAATVVLSLIGIYTTNNSQNTWGEEYQVTILMKVIHANTTYTFTNGTVADNTALSTLCGTMYRKQSSVKSFAACIMTNFIANGPFNDSVSGKRRRRANVGVGTQGTYMYGYAKLYYSTKCQGKTNNNTYVNSTSLANCIKKRLTECNAFYNSTSTTLTPWTPLPTPFSLSAVESSFITYVALIVTNLLSAPPNIAAATNISVPNLIRSQFAAGCRYIGPISQADIAGNVALQSSATTAAPSTPAVG